MFWILKSCILLAMAKDIESGATYGELGIEPQLLDNPRIFAGSEAAIVLRLGTGENDLATDEDKEDDLGLHHTVDQTGEQLRLVGRESVMARCKTLQTNGELDVARADDILNLKVLVAVS